MSKRLPEALPDDLATVWYLIRRLASAMDRRSDRLCRAELGVSFAHYLVLSVVDAHPGAVSQQAIADRLGLTKGTVSRQIDTAVDAGLMTVRVADHSRREKSLALTDAGTRLVRSGDALTSAARAEMSQTLTPTELRETVTALRALLEVAQGE